MEGNDDELKKQINWCVMQLIMGLKHKKPNSKQVKESNRVLKILTSNKTPLVKKRQVMRLTFGDYRAKIQKEDERLDKETMKLLQSTKIVIASPDMLKKGSSLRKTRSVSSLESSINQLKISTPANFTFNFDIEGC